MKLEEIKNKTNEAVSYLVTALESGQSDVLTQYLNAMARFHNYSFGNIMLIARRKPQATNVAGIRTWNSLGRFVKRGEKGILILAPMISRKKTDGAADSTADAKEATAKLYGFRAVYVFDVTQTEGKDLPALTALTEVEGDVSGYRERLVKFVESQNVTLNYSERIAPAKGLSFGGKITLLSGMQPAEEFSTLVHEIAHEMLHRGERRTLTTKQVRETEAEAVAFVVCQSVGLQTGTASADYIQLWHGDAKRLQESLEVVQHTAAVILGGIAPEAVKPQPPNPTTSIRSSPETEVEMCLKNQIKRRKQNPVRQYQRDVPNRTSAKVTLEPAPLIQESLKESPTASKRKVYCNQLLMWEKNPGKTTKRSWPEQNLCVLPHRSSSS